MTFKELTLKAKDLIEEAKALQDKADSEKRLLTQEETTKVEGLLKEAEETRAQATIARRIETSVASFDEPIPTVTGNFPPVGTVPAQPRDKEAEARHHFNHIGEFAMAVYKAGLPKEGAWDQRLSIGAEMRQAVGSEGGFAVPPAFSTTIWDGLNVGTRNLLGMTDNYTVTGESITFPANAETSRATGSRYGGIRGYWINEGAQITDSAPKLRQVKLEPQELAVLVYVTNKLLGNSTALEQYLTRGATEEINFMVGDAIINGNGAGKPLGILNSGCLVTVAKEGSQAATTVLTENLYKMWARLHVNSQARAVWLINQDVGPELDNLFIAVKNVAGAENVGGFAGFIYNPERQTIKGRPIIPIEFCATLGTVGDVILADMSAYATGTTGGVDSAMSIHLKFDYAKTAFRFIFAVDGQPWLASALTPYKGSNTLSTFIALATRS